MKVKLLHNPGELEQTEPFQVDNLLWGTEKIPETYGYIGFLPGDGFYLKMVCKEKNPLRTFSKDKDPVYRDSAMEAFFMFETNRTGNSVYLNFEVNANGALLAAYGEGRTYRSYFAEDAYRQFDCKAEIEEDKWSVTLRIPLSILKDVYGPLEIGEGSSFTCNFYKISEKKEIEHYASWSPVRTEVPSFHLPEFFGTAVIE